MSNQDNILSSMQINTDLLEMLYQEITLLKDRVTSLESEIELLGKAKEGD